ncbi:uncharacterized protein METZ01_LOCUS359240, partial [marine metagenome]
VNAFIRHNGAAIREISLYMGAYFVYVLPKGLVHSDTRAEGLVNGEIRQTILHGWVSVILAR